MRAKGIVVYIVGAIQESPDSTYGRTIAVCFDKEIVKIKSFFEETLY